MSHEHIQVAAREGVLTIALDRPDVLNSLDARMAAELLEALRAAATDDAVRCVRLTGNGRAFCAGQDLADVLPAAGRPAPDLGEVVARQYTPIVLAIRTMEKPVVCAVNGVAAGAGANIAFACDLVVASEDASFIQSFTRIGLIPDSGGTFLLPRLIGLQRAAALVMLGDKLEARRARLGARPRRRAPRGARRHDLRDRPAARLHADPSPRPGEARVQRGPRQRSRRAARARGGAAARGRTHRGLRRRGARVHREAEAGLPRAVG
jgi:2-(1,2-epoxy-1,2-dihydrophenyl)acetyl-CoA isomerase